MELTLDQMLADPIVRQLMARDGVVEADIRGLAAHVPRRAARPPADTVRRPSEARSFGIDPGP